MIQSPGNTHTQEKQRKDICMVFSTINECSRAGVTQNVKPNFTDHTLTAMFAKGFHNIQTLNIVTVSEKMLQDVSRTNLTEVLFLLLPTVERSPECMHTQPKQTKTEAHD